MRLTDPGTGVFLTGAVFEHTHVLLVALSTDGRVRRANPAALSAVATTLPQVEGRPIEETPWWPGDAASRANLTMMIRDAVQGESGRGEARLGHDANAIDVDLYVEPIRDASDAVVSVLVEAHDVTWRVRSEAALRASEAKFSGILSIAADAIISVDDAMRIVHFNQGAEHIFGYPASHAIGMTLDMLLPERFRTVHGAHIAAFGRSHDNARRMGERREIFGLRRDGTEFPAEASISRLDLPTGRLFTVVLRDVTERKRIEQNQRFLVSASTQLARSLELDRAAHIAVQIPVDYLADIALIDLVEDGRFVRFVSEAADPEIDAAVHALVETIHLTWDSPSRVIDVIRSGQAELLNDLSDQWLEAHVQNEAELRAARGLRLQSAMLVPLLARGVVAGAMTFGRVAPGAPYDEFDLTLAQDLASRVALSLDNAVLYGQAQLATRARDDVLGVVSHDLRNPLSAIAMCTRALLEQLPPEREAQRELLRTAYDSTQWMHRMIQDLLDVSSIEAGKLAVERRREDVDVLIERTLSMFEREADQRGVRLVHVDGHGVPPVLADADRIVQVLANLVGNAMKYTPSGGSITLSTEPAGGDVALTVSDTGAGIPPEHLAHIFDRYWQARRSSAKRGAGLGLAISRGIVEAHGGRITVESSVGEGSTFRFTLPASEEGS